MVRTGRWYASIIAVPPPTMRVVGRWSFSSSAWNAERSWPASSGPWRGGIATSLCHGVIRTQPRCPAGRPGAGPGALPRGAPLGTRGIERSHEEGAHHWNHWPGRQLPRGAAARKGLRGPRHHPPLLLLQHLADRPHLPGPAHRGLPPVPPLRRPERRLLAEPPPEAAAPRRDLQPRRAEPREGLLRRPGVHGRGDRARRHAAPRGGARARPHEDPHLPGLLLGDVRRLAAAAEREDPVLPAQPLRLRQGLRLLDRRELPRGLQAPRLERHPLQPRGTAPRRDVR